MSAVPGRLVERLRGRSRLLLVGLACWSVAAGACGKQRAEEDGEPEAGGAAGDRVAAAAAGAAGATGLAAVADAREVEAAAALAFGPESLPPGFGFGRSAAPAQIAALDIDVRPDGLGLPAGSGTVARGAAIFAIKCARCHGPTGTEGPSDVLVGREPRDGFLFGQYTSLTRTIGNYWPYATTLYDYIGRAMPLDAPGSLTPGEVYSLAAWLLYRNEVLPADAVLDAARLPDVRMPARDRFVADDRTGGAAIR